MVTLPTLSKVDDKEQHMAVYIKPTKLNELEDLKKDLVNVLSAYLNKDNETLQKYDLSDNPKVVQDYLDNFIYRNET
ncbi:hypothetical protein OEK97_28555, partial [Escherichia coli]|uniref:hypothetical protein n=1 Tax=Escherichia coli TaxID=562 RepID=UPI0021DB6474